MFSHLKRALWSCVLCLMMPLTTLAESPTLSIPAWQTEPAVQTSSEDTFIPYLQRETAPGTGKQGPRKAISINRLTGIHRALYNGLLPQIREVAAGVRASTEFTVDLAELGFESVSWTAEELGVEAIVVDHAITQEAQAAGMAKLGFRMRSVLDTLLTNAPLELYWYDKTQATSYGLFTATSSGGDEWRLRTVESFSIRFPVAAAYAGSDAYTIDTALVDAALDAAQAAQAIVLRHADESDMDKLTAYRQEICALTDYNHAAADDDGTAYGNPWQLVWVFDGDASTTVVCEGYAKAFQYLCDITAFRDDVRCWTVTGQMLSGGSGEGHMWNVVAMPDGQNYLADVTNCDTGSVGAPDLLFFKAPVSQDMTEYGFSTAQGYAFAPNGHTVIYLYDDNMLALYAPEELALAMRDYVPVTRYAQTVSLPEGTRVIEAKAFAGWTQGVNLRIPASVTDIDDTAFDGSALILLCAPDSAALAFARSHDMTYIVE